MLPFLKKRMEAAASDEDTPTQHRKHDEDFDMLDAVVEDFYQAFESKDKRLLRSALEGLCDYIKDWDEDQDQELLKEET